MTDSTPSQQPLVQRAAALISGPRQDPVALPEQDTAIVSEFVRTQQAIVDILDEAQKARIDLARMTLARAFPDHDHVVVSKHWTEDVPNLIQALTTKEDAGVQHLSLEPGESDWDERLTHVQRHAVSAAECLVRMVWMDGGENLLDNDGLIEHDDWVESGLDLTKARA